MNTLLQGIFLCFVTLEILNNIAKEFFLMAYCSLLYKKNCLIPFIQVKTKHKTLIYAVAVVIVVVVVVAVVVVGK
jgi:hypothetical protein